MSWKVPSDFNQKFLYQAPGSYLKDKVSQNSVVRIHEWEIKGWCIPSDTAEFAWLHQNFKWQKSNFWTSRRNNGLGTISIFTILIIIRHYYNAFSQTGLMQTKTSIGERRQWGKKKALFAGRYHACPPEQQRGIPPAASQQWPGHFMLLFLLLRGCRD